MKKGEPVHNSAVNITHLCPIILNLITVRLAVATFQKNAIKSCHNELCVDLWGSGEVIHSPVMFSWVLFAMDAETTEAKALTYPDLCWNSICADTLQQILNSGVNVLQDVCFCRKPQRFEGAHCDAENLFLDLFSYSIKEYYKWINTPRSRDEEKCYIYDLFQTGFTSLHGSVCHMFPWHLNPQIRVGLGYFYSSSTTWGFCSQASFSKFLGSGQSNSFCGSW